MLFFIGSEAFFFIALIIAYVYYRAINDNVDLVSANLDAKRTGLFTVLLVSSSFSLLWSKYALRKNHWKTYKILLVVTILLGVVFMYGQIKEYVGLYHKQLTMSASIFGSSFFTLTGFHGLHVIIGLITLSILLMLSFGKTKILCRSAIGGIDVYWHFVDVVWLFVFFFVYIKPLL